MTITTEYETQLDDRSITYVWDTGIRKQDRLGEQVKVIAELSVHHFKHDKQFTADFRNIEVGPVFRSTKIAIGVRPAFGIYEPVARYSQKALEDFAARALAMLLERLADGDEGVAAVFDGSAA